MFLLSAVGVLVEMVEGCILVSTAALWGSFEVNSTLFFFFLSAVCWRVGRLSVETGSCSVPDLLLLDPQKVIGGESLCWEFCLGLGAFDFLFFLLCLDMVLYYHPVQRRSWMFVLGGRRWMTKRCEGGMICGR